MIDYLQFDLEVQYDAFNEQLLLVGLYGEGKHNYSKKRGFKGAFQAIWKKSESYFNPVSYSVLPTFNDVSAKKEKILVLENYELMPLVLRKDGGLLLMAEQRYVYQSGGVFGDSPSSGEVDYNYKDILLVSLDKNGEIEWSKILHKEQFSTNDNARYSSFFVFKNRSSIRILFNDHIQWNSGILEYTIAPKGKIERNVIPHHKKRHKVTLELVNSVQVSANSFLSLSRYQSFGNMKVYLSKLTY